MSQSNNVNSFGMLFKLKLMAIWDVLQSIFGASEGKTALYRNLVNCHEGESVLDFGCATGANSIGFIDCNYLGVDIHEPSIALAKMKYEGGKFSKLKFKCVDIFNMVEGEFDHILCACTGHHLTDNQVEEITSALIDKLGKNGKLHFIDNARTANDSAIVKILFSIDRGRYIRKIDQYDEIFKRITNGRIIKRELVQPDSRLAKFSFCYFKFVKS